MQKNVVIAGYVRSPFHFAKKGNLARVRPDELAAQVVRGLVEKTGVNTADIEDLIGTATDQRSGYHGQSILWVFDAIHSHGGWRDSNECR
jgi:acetyl-CoA acetyltransferase